MATRKERRVHRKQQHSNFELVRESKVIWEHLRPNKATPGKTLALDEIMALAKGHFKEVGWCVCGCGCVHVCVCV